METQTLSTIKSAIDKQYAYFHSGKTLSFESRREALKKLNAIITQYEAEIFQAVEQDLGKCNMEAFTTEVGIVQAEISHTLKHLRAWMSPEWASTGLINFPASSKIMSEPYGVTLNIAPWNYPFQLAIAPAIGALAAGNTMIIKPSELAPATSSILAKIINPNFDEGLLHVIEGAVEETTELLNHKWDYIFFTGGTQIGKIVYQAAAKYLTPVTLELGGKSPTIVHSSANIKISARRIAWGKFLNAGQTCVAPDYIMVEESIKDEFIKHLKAEIEKLYGTNPIQNKEFGKIINNKHFNRLLSYLKDVNVIYGGQYDEQACKIAPSIVEPNSLDSTIMNEEIFGPIMPIITFKTVEEVITKVKSKSKPLALYIFSNKETFTNQILNQTSSGGVCVNDVIMHMTGSSLPFGGVGDSGIGAYHGKFSFDTFSHKKAVLHRQFWLDAPLRYPPFNKIPLSLLKKLLKHVL